MLISRLRLLGFKSFVEPIELVIEPGLTGVVGPNGCGKSNLLEALRWVMGESSYKSMRGSAMDDVIFSGTTTRPARNMAEVTMFIDNTARRAPADYNDADTIEITRRIEREAGSAYRINGREARARDVKILFEDAATGARSPALVRQGQIGDIVNAKPEQRRRILEDAAGIAGLHSRRHEAELRLRPAEANLTRLADVLGGLKSQIESLKRQARQARRYKGISGRIRQTEALHLYLSWNDAQAQVDAQEAELREALSLLGDATKAEAEALRAETSLSDAMQPTREEQATRSAVLGRLRIEAENFEREAQRSAEREQELSARAQQLETDLAREHTAANEATELLTKIDGDVEKLDSEETRADAAEKASKHDLAAAETELSNAELHLAKLTRQQAEINARTRSLETSLADRNDTITRLNRHLSVLQVQHDELTADAPDRKALGKAAKTIAGLQREAANIEERATEIEEQIGSLVEDLKEKREATAAARLKENALKTERETLRNLLLPQQAGDFPAVVDQLKVKRGYETALGAALGDDLDAPIDNKAAVHWRRLSQAKNTGKGNRSSAPLPADVKPLSTFVKAPAELALRLGHIGLVDKEQGSRLQAKLLPGQRLVSREGDLWRWDGFVAASDGSTAAAQRLAQRNRLTLIEDEEATARESVETSAAIEAEAAKAVSDAEQSNHQIRASRRDTQTKLAASRDDLAKLERSASETDSKLAAIAGAKSGSEQELADSRAKASELETSLAEAAKADDLESQLTEANANATKTRNDAAEKRAEYAGLARERAQRKERLATLKSELTRWSERQKSAKQHIDEVTKRLAGTRSELQTFAELPGQIETRRQKLMNGLADAERDHKQASDQLAAAENELKQATTVLRELQAAVTEAREGRARIEAQLEASRTRRQDEARRIRETFDVAPEDCLGLAEVDVETGDLPSFSEIDHKLSKLKADRERLGGVNLQADDELENLAAQFDGLEGERADVEEAIGKLRGAISKLNREGKKRLNEAFEIVNGHFRRLFSTLFGGGEARLEMVESEEDPLEGGLEIIARPPGKKPATLSLLSGGEQTLTALSLIFAVFLTNPSPICVLDEVDAPLDDANVDRFCLLMEKMAEETATRFLVITHHPMTMTRMNRLFGVTMAEKGVSQLVSVDLETAQGFREAG